MTLNEQMFLKIEMETWKLFTPQESISPPPPTQLSLLYKTQR